MSLHKIYNEWMIEFIQYCCIYLLTVVKYHTFGMMNDENHRTETSRTQYGEDGVGRRKSGLTVYRATSGV